MQTRQSHFALRKHRQVSEQHKQEDNMPNMRNILFSVGMEEKRNGRTEWGISCEWLRMTSRGRNEYSVFSQDTQNLLSAELSNTSFIIMSCSYSIDKELALYSLFKKFLWILQQFLYFNTDLFELNWYKHTTMVSVIRVQRKADKFNVVFSTGQKPKIRFHQY